MDQKKNEYPRLTVPVSPETRVALADIENVAGISPGAVVRKFMAWHAAELQQYAEQLRTLPPGSPYRAALVGRIHTVDQHGNLGEQV